jgi:ABC-2 type transport system permease protein
VTGPGSSASGRPPGGTAGRPSGPGLFPAGTFTPAPEPAPAATKALAFAALELKLLVRNGEQLLLVLLLPLAALVGSTLTTVVTLPEPRVNSVTPGALALAVLGTAFTSQAIVTGFDRRYGVLRRLAAAGVGRSQLVGGKVLAVLACLAGQVLVLGVVAALLGWRPAGSVAGGVLWSALLLVLAAAALVGLALFVGGTLRAEAVLGVANLVWLLLVALGGVIVPLDQAPGWLRTVGELTPVGALSQGLRDVLTDGAAPGPWHLVVLLAWAAAGWAATVRWFRWQ